MRPRPTAADRARWATLTERAVPGTPLTSRQRTILAELAAGYTTAQIGSRLYLSHATVKTQLHRIYSKLQVSNAAAAVDAGWRLGYLGDGTPAART